jgi:hypothetical protein
MTFLFGCQSSDRFYRNLAAVTSGCAAQYYWYADTQACGLCLLLLSLHHALNLLITSASRILSFEILPSSHHIHHGSLINFGLPGPLVHIDVQHAKHHSTNVLRARHPYSLQCLNNTPNTWLLYLWRTWSSRFGSQHEIRSKNDTSKNWSLSVRVHDTDQTKAGHSQLSTQTVLLDTMDSNVTQMGVCHNTIAAGDYKAFA